MKGKERKVKDMTKCQIAIEANDSCQMCCCFCEQKDTCQDRCKDMENPCEEMVEEESGLQVIANAVPDVLKAITEITVQKKKLEEQEKLMREKLQEAMEQHGIKSFENADVKFVYVAPTTRKTFDKKAFEKAHPEINLADYDKVSNVKASVKITVK